MAVAFMAQSTAGLAASAAGLAAPAAGLATSAAMAVVPPASPRTARVATSAAPATFFNCISVDLLAPSGAENNRTPPEACPGIDGIHPRAGNIPAFGDGVKLSRS